MVSQKIRLILLCFALLLAAPPAIKSQDAARIEPTAVSKLETGAPVESDIGSGEVQIYRVGANDGDFVRVTIEQKNSDVALQVFAPDGGKLYEVNQTSARGETERVSFVAPARGEYRFEIRLAANFPSRAAGKSYLIRLAALRSPTEQDRSQIAAEKLYDRAAVLSAENKAESRRAALKIFSEAVPHFQAAGDQAGEAQTFYAVGVAHSLLSEYPPAIENYAKAAQIFRRLDLKPQLAGTMVGESGMHLFRGDNRKAEELSLAALDIYRELGDRRGAAEMMGNLGVLANRKNEPRRALEYFEQSLPILRAENDRDQEARVLRSIGFTYASLGEPFKAIEAVEQALAISRADKEQLGLSTALISLGTLSKNVGEVQRAIEQLNEALGIVRQLGNRRSETITLNNLGSYYEYLGEIETAREYHEKALALARQLKMRDYEINSLSNLANLELYKDNTPKALEMFTQAFEIARETGNKRTESRMLARLGETRLKLGDAEKALELFNRALPVLREIEDREWEALTLFLTGTAHRRNGALEASRAALAQALEIAREMKTPFVQAQIYWEMAQVEKDSKNLPAAQTHLENAIEIAENVRAKLSRQDLRATYFSSQQSFYELYVGVLAAQGKNAEALRASERARARSLLDSLGESQANIRAGVAPALLEQENNLRQIINAKDLQRLNAVKQKQTEKAAEFEKELAALLPQYRDAQAAIRRQSPQFAALTQPEPLNLGEIQTQVLDKDSILLEYFLGAEQSFLFAVTGASLEVFELPGRAAIEKTARRFVESLRAPAKEVSGETAAARHARLTKADDERQTSGVELSRMLLAPVAAKIQNKRLLIVASDVLQYVPFAALKVQASNKVQGSRFKVQGLNNGGQRTKDKGRFLIETNEIATLPSASALAALRKTKPNRRENNENILAILADPVFSPEDVRLKASAKQSGTQNPAATEAKNETLPSRLRADFVRLRFSRQEAETIAAFAPDGKKIVALDFAANLQTANGENLRKARIIHFATHGFINSDFPELSGLVLSLVDETGGERDGFLRLHDVYNLRLDSQLVVLSACETALGKEIRGEGIVGLTRGFMYAGASSAVASLWKVDDRSTAELMRRFYQKMLKENLRPAAALRAAQVSLAADRATQNPFYWAAFTLQGEYR